jgi:hypothetical protein
MKTLMMMTDMVVVMIKIDAGASKIQAAVEMDALMKVPVWCFMFSLYFQSLMIAMGESS